MNAQVMTDEHQLATKMERKRGLTLVMLEQDFKVSGYDRQLALSEAWESTLSLIATAKLWIDGLKAIHYSQPAKYLQHVRDYSRDAALKLSKRIRRAGYVYNSFHIIMENLNKYPIIDRRGLSIEVLEKCKSLAWVVKYAAQLREKTDKPDEPRWSEEDFRDLVNAMVTSRAFMSVRDQPDLAANLLHKASLACLSWTSLKRP